MSEEDDDKQHEASQKRLDDARKRGEIPKSTDLTTAAAYAGLVLILAVGGSALLQQFGQAAMVLLDQPDRLAPVLFANALGFAEADFHRLDASEQGTVDQAPRIAF